MVAERGKRRSHADFSVQLRRNRICNQTCNRCPSEGKAQLLGFRIRYFGEIFSPGFGAGYALPAFLNAVLRVTLSGFMSLPALDIATRNAGVHDLADEHGPVRPSGHSGCGGR